MPILPFASPVLSRIGRHNAHRLPRSQLEAATELASEFELDLDLTLSDDEMQGPGSSPQHDLQGARVVLYSLMAPALGRASRILERRYPGIATQALSAKVANHELRAASRDADVLVIADKAAAHAATDAIKAARGDKPIDYATGRGTVSLVDAAARGLERLGARGVE
jgi:hypothetical protein